MNILFYVILAIILLQFAIDAVVDYLNAKKFKEAVPKELDGIFNEEEYKKSQRYKTANYRFGLFSGAFSLFLTLSFLIFGGFGWVDGIARSITDNPILIAIVFFGIIMIGSSVLNVPLAYYSTFVIEEKFDFNKSTKKLFFIDLLKSWVLTAVIGGALLTLVIWFYNWAGTNFWIYAWVAIAVISVFMNMFYSKLIVPLFNKQKPLENGTLKTKIEEYAKKVGFQLQNIFIIDGSKRSTKANAYFSGFGKQKRITLYDTLVKDLDEEEIIAVLAHEVGHYKRRHILFNLAASILLTGLTLYILSIFINNPDISLAIGVSIPSFHAALIGFGILYSPISEITSLIMNYLSRKFEYQADDYAKKTYAHTPLITSLKKLSKTSLSNLTPHPAYVFMNYSHPTLLDRINNLKK
ncbi:M48 family metallopeptidase [Cellulophaga sp. 20_2_10]|uniref:M48 family metallopeptidase n=1 Tax=Cellulophaga sp. 20_2_10 TaxID=2942476 RepID=UPI00201AA5D3|nr:M48 family metallopeptidase [Cellulophaga sp. 20_2_10]MCL5246074.1 M48 family metallopeptidase [Cellulophaga sp. 20_2_10]